MQPWLNHSLRPNHCAPLTHYLAMLPTSYLATHCMAGCMAGCVAGCMAGCMAGCRRVQSAYPYLPTRYVISPACAECLPLPPNSLCDLTCVYMVKKFTSRPPTFCSSMIARLVGC